MRIDGIRPHFSSMFWSILLLPVFALANSGFLDSGSAYYFGIGHSVDFRKAWGFFEKDSNWEFLVLMRLNGEGVAPSAKEAEHLLREGIKAQAIGNSDRAHFEAAIKERLSHPNQIYPRLEYCNDVLGGTTPEIDYCLWIGKEQKKYACSMALDSVKAGLPPKARRLFAAIIVAFDSLATSEANRAYQGNVEGSGRGWSSSEAEEYLRDRFVSLVREIVQSRQLKRVDSSEYKTADADLNRNYLKDLRRNGYEEYLNNTKFKDSWERFKGEAADYKKAARTAELRWIHYRDVWAKLTPLLYGDSSAIPDPALSIKTLLSKKRVEELCHDPISPGYDGNGNICDPDEK